MQQMTSPVWLRDKACPRRNAYLAGQRIAPPGLTGTESLAEVVERAMLAYRHRTETMRLLRDEPLANFGSGKAEEGEPVICLPAEAPQPEPAA
jgi:hypothetical protein